MEQKRPADIFQELLDYLHAKILLIFMQKYRISLNNCRFSPIFL